jgi:hypothetical protein
MLAKNRAGIDLYIELESACNSFLLELDPGRDLNLKSLELHTGIGC